MNYRQLSRVRLAVSVVSLASGVNANTLHVPQVHRTIQAAIDEVPGLFEEMATRWPTATDCRG